MSSEILYQISEYFSPVCVLLTFLSQCFRKWSKHPRHLQWTGHPGPKINPAHSKRSTLISAPLPIPGAQNFKAESKENGELGIYVTVTFKASRNAYSYCTVKVFCPIVRNFLGLAKGDLILVWRRKWCDKRLSFAAVTTEGRITGWRILVKAVM